MDAKKAPKRGGDLVGKKFIGFGSPPRYGGAAGTTPEKNLGFEKYVRLGGNLIQNFFYILNDRVEVIQFSVIDRKDMVCGFIQGDVMWV